MTDLCHCGSPVYMETTDEEEWEVAEHMNLSLAYGYCVECALVRCDAYPGACSPASHSSESGV